MPKQKTKFTITGHTTLGRSNPVEITIKVDLTALYNDGVNPTAIVAAMQDDLSAVFQDRCDDRKAFKIAKEDVAELKKSYKAFCKQVEA